MVYDFIASWVRNNFWGTEGMSAPYEIRPCSNAPAISSHCTSQTSNCSSAAVVGIDAKPVLKCDKMWELPKARVLILEPWGPFDMFGCQKRLEN